MKTGETDKKSISKILYSIKSYFSVQANVLIVFFAVLLLVLTVYPMYSVIRSSVTVGNMDAMMYNSLFGLKLRSGDITLLNFKMLLANAFTKEYSVSFFWKPLWNSLRMSTYASLIAILLGGTVAFLITRTDIYCKKFFSSVFILSFLTSCLPGRWRWCGKTCSAILLSAQALSVCWKALQESVCRPGSSMEFFPALSSWGSIMRRLPIF